MATYGPSFASAGNNVAGYGFASWSNPGNVTADDNTTATVTLAPGNTSQYLEGVCPNPSLPGGATINSITVTVGRSKTGLTNIIDDRARLAISGTVGSNDQSNGTNWPGSETATNYVFTTGLPTVADFNAGNVAFYLACHNSGGANSGNAVVDYIKFTIDYTPAAGGTPRVQVVVC